MQIEEISIKGDSKTKLKHHQIQNNQSLDKKQLSISPMKQKSGSQLSLQRMTQAMKEIYRNPVLSNMFNIEPAQLQSERKILSTQRLISSNIKKRNKRPRIDLSAKLSNMEQDEILVSKVIVNLKKHHAPFYVDRVKEHNIPTSQLFRIVQSQIRNDPTSMRIKTEASQGDDQPSISYSQVQNKQFRGVYLNQRTTFHNEKYISSYFKDLKEQNIKLSDKRYFINTQLKQRQRYREMLDKAERLKRSKSTNKSVHDESPIEFIKENWDKGNGNKFIRLKNINIDGMIIQIMNNLKENQNASKSFKIQLERFEELNLSSQSVLRNTVNIYSQLKCFVEISLFSPDNTSSDNIQSQLMQSYFYRFQLSNQQVFQIKNAIVKSLSQLNLNNQISTYLFIQLEWFRFYIQRPPLFLNNIFAEEIYSKFVLKLMMKLMKCNQFKKQMLALNQDMAVIFANIQKGLFPFLVGNYIFPQHQSVRHYEYRYSKLITLIHAPLLECLHQALVEEKLDMSLVFDIIQKMESFRAEPIEDVQEAKMQQSNLYQHLLKEWMQKKQDKQFNKLPTWDIQAMLKEEYLQNERDVLGQGTAILDMNLLYLHDILLVSEFQQIITLFY